MSPPFIPIVDPIEQVDDADDCERARLTRVVFDRYTEARSSARWSALAPDDAARARRAFADIAAFHAARAELDTFMDEGPADDDGPTALAPVVHPGAFA